MIICMGLNNTLYSVKKDKLAAGGEGSIHEIKEDNSLVAKIFKEKKRNKRIEEKLLFIVRKKYSDGSKLQVAWPTDVIYKDGMFIGYIMPKINSIHLLNDVYVTGSKSYNLKEKLLVAINLCIVVKNIHDKGQVLGDMNPQNISVNLDKKDTRNAFHVTLVDSDSFHLQSSTETFRCEVGRGEYMAPELSNRLSAPDNLNLITLDLPTYTRETDLFALAVHIFTLLMNGCHPFACARKMGDVYVNTMNQFTEKNVRESVVLPQPVENIKTGFFPFYHKKEGITYPVYAPSFESLPENVRKLFIRTFVDGYKNPNMRPLSEEWIDVLKTDCVGHLRKCEKNEKHYYFNHNIKCPFCESNKRQRLLLLRKKTAFNIETETDKSKEKLYSNNKVKVNANKKTVNKNGYNYDLFANTHDYNYDIFINSHIDKDNDTKNKINISTDKLPIIIVIAILTIYIVIVAIQAFL